MMEGVNSTKYIARTFVDVTMYLITTIKKMQSIKIIKLK
jgi:hypothetical protein